MRVVVKLANDYINFCKECCMYASVSTLLSRLPSEVGAHATCGDSKTLPEQNRSSSTLSTTDDCTRASRSSACYIYQNQAWTTYPLEMI